MFCRWDIFCFAYEWNILYTCCEIYFDKVVWRLFYVSCYLDIWDNLHSFVIVIIIMYLNVTSYIFLTISNMNWISDFQTQKNKILKRNDVQNILLIMIKSWIRIHSGKRMDTMSSSVVYEQLLTKHKKQSLNGLLLRFLTKIHQNHIFKIFIVLNEKEEKNNS